MYENLFKNPLHRVFVYGTLKRGEPNHGIIKDTANGHAKFLGFGRTTIPYPLVIATKYNIPFLLKKPNIGNVSLMLEWDVHPRKIQAEGDESVDNIWLWIDLTFSYLELSNLHILSYLYYTMSRLYFHEIFWFTEFEHLISVLLTVYFNIRLSNQIDALLMNSMCSVRYTTWIRKCSRGWMNWRSIPRSTSELRTKFH